MKRRKKLKLRSLLVNLSLSLTLLLSFGLQILGDYWWKIQSWRDFSEKKEKKMPALIPYILYLNHQNCLSSFFANVFNDDENVNEKPKKKNIHIFLFLSLFLWLYSTDVYFGFFLLLLLLWMSWTLYTTKYHHHYHHHHYYHP
mgnify:CR=1 FL=1